MEREMNQFCGNLNVCRVHTNNMPVIWAIPVEAKSFFVLCLVFQKWKSTKIGQDLLD